MIVNLRVVNERDDFFFLVSDMIEIHVNEKRSFEPREIGRRIGFFFSVVDV